MREQNLIHSPVKQLRHVFLFNQLFNNFRPFSFIKCSLFEFLSLVEQQNWKPVDVFKNVVIDLHSQKLLCSFIIVINYELSILQVKTIGEMFFPDGLIKLLESLEVVFYYSFLIFFIK